MPAKIRLADGREITVMLSGKRVVEELLKPGGNGIQFTRFKSAQDTPVWVNPRQVAAVEDRPDLG